MDVTIKRYVQKRFAGFEVWRNYPEEAVRKYAKELVKAGLADRVEIVDMQQRIHFRWPPPVRLK